MFYANVDKTHDPQRTATRLLQLRTALRESGVPEKCNQTLLLATWNIREFDSPAYGERSLEAMYYIAEICSHYDLIAIQEVREDLSGLKRLNRILGNHWDYLVTDVNEGVPGNRERLAFLYDTRKVRFSGVAGEVVMPAVKDATGKTKYQPANQLYRTPFLCSFQVGWAKILLCTVHIQYGENTANSKDRVEEIRLIAQTLGKRAKERKNQDNLILLGDFNIFSPEDQTMTALLDAGFSIPEALQTVPASNVGSSKRHYDQIASMSRVLNLEPTGKAGIFDYFNVVYTAADQTLYDGEQPSQMGEAYHRTSKNTPRNEASQRRYYKTYWRTHQMSDHLPMWIEFKVDFSEEYLRRRWIDKS